MKNSLYQVLILAHLLGSSTCAAESSKLTLVAESQENPRISQIMWAFDSHKDLHGKALLDAVENDVKLLQMPLIDLLVTFSGIDFKLGIDLVARAIVDDDAALKKFMHDKTLKDFFPVVARFYYLIKNKHLPEATPDIYSFSITDWLNYNPGKIDLRFSAGEWRLFLRRNLYLVSLDGINQIIGVTDVKHLYINNETNIGLIKDGTFEGMGTLRSLMIVRNKELKLMVGSFRGLSSLESLRISDCDLSDLMPGVLAGLVDMRIVAFDSNNLTQLVPGIFEGLAHLREINLSCNGIVHLDPDVFIGLNNLETVDLYANLYLSLLDNHCGQTNKDVLKNAFPRVKFWF
jgi:hypothetical protein